MEYQIIDLFNFGNTLYYGIIGLFILGIIIFAMGMSKPITEAYRYFIFTIILLILLIITILYHSSYQYNKASQLIKGYLEQNTTKSNQKLALANLKDAPLEDEKGYYLILNEIYKTKMFTDLYPNRDFRYVVSKEAKDYVYRIEAENILKDIKETEENITLIDK